MSTLPLIIANTFTRWFKGSGDGTELDPFIPQVASGGSAELFLSPDFILAVKMGKVSGFATVDKFGACFDISDDTVVQDIWEPGTEYVFSTSQDIDTVSSSSASDVGHIIKIYGICDPANDDGETVGYAGLNGQNKVLIYDNEELTGDAISFFRVYRAENESLSTDYGGVGGIDGMVYIFVDGDITNGVPDESDDIRAVIDDGNNQTQMAIYTCPPKKVGFLYRGELGVELTAGASSSVDFVRAQYQSRRYQHVFKSKKPISALTAGTSAYQDVRSFPDIIPALTDIKITKIQASDDIGAFATFDILLVDEDQFTDEYLAAIGQMGY